MSQLNKNVSATPTGGCRIKDPNQKDVPFVGFAAQQLAGFDKTENKAKENPNRHYQDEVSVGDVGRYQLKGQRPKKTVI